MNKTQAAAVKIGDTLRTAHFPARDVEVISIHQDGTRTARYWGTGHRVFPVFGVRVHNDKHSPEEVSYSDLRVPQEVYDGDIIEEAGPCRECNGSGLYATKTWDEPEIKCDECNGTGYDQEEEDERQRIMDQRREAEVECAGCRAAAEEDYRLSTPEREQEWWYFLEDCQISAKGNVLTTGVKMTGEEVENAQAFLNGQGLNHLRWHPMDPD